MKSNDNSQNQSLNKRRQIIYSTSFTDNLISLRNPWVVAWWSAAFPGFGHFMLCKYLVGFSLFISEVLINVFCGINTAIFYSFIGDFDKAKEVLDFRFVPIYIGGYIFGIWDTYRRTVEINQQYILAYHETRYISPFSISALEISYLDKRKPWISALFSSIIPGLGYVYINRLISAAFAVIWLVIITYYSGLYIAVFYTVIGDFGQVSQVLDPQWFLFMPSIYLFSIYDSYAYTVELNKAFEKEQAHFLKEKYQIDKLNALTIFFNKVR